MARVTRTVVSQRERPRLPKSWKIFETISAVLVVVGIVSLLARGFKLDRLRGGSVRRYLRETHRRPCGRC
jgi:hypothetical protein